MWWEGDSAPATLAILPVQEGQAANGRVPFTHKQQPQASALSLCTPQAEDAAPDSFYGDPACRSMFKAAAQALVGRTNAVTGVRYRCVRRVLYLLSERVGRRPALKHRALGSTLPPNHARFAPGTTPPSWPGL